MFLIRPAGANQSAKVAIGGGGPLLGSAIYGMPAGSSGPSAPTVPVARQSWSAGMRLTDWADNLFGPGEIRNFRLPFQNLSGQTVSDISFDLVQSRAAASLFTYSVGIATGPSSYDAVAWTTPATILVPAAPNGIYAPGYARVDVTLPAPLAPDGDLIISINAPTSAVTITQNWNANAWPAFSVGRAAMSFSPVAVDASWPGGFGDVGAFLGGVHLRNLSGSPVVQMHFLGDSVVEMERPYTSSPNPLSREGIFIRGNLLEQANGPRFWAASYANGSFPLNGNGYLARISHLVTTSWIDTADIVGIEILTQNEHPEDLTAADAQIAAIEAVEAEVRAAGRGVVYILLAPPSLNHQTAPEIAAFQAVKAHFATKSHAYFDDIVADGTGTAFAPAYSEDLVHINEAGQIAQAAVWSERMAVAVAAEGYTV